VTISQQTEDKREFKIAQMTLSAEINPDFIVPNLCNCRLLER
jgi:hypothetical protein